jgi:hypothetical protein
MRYYGVYGVMSNVMRLSRARAHRLNFQTYLKFGQYR